MNARLKAIVRERGYVEARIAALISLYDGDELAVEQMLTGRMKSNADAHLKAAYKAAAQMDMPALVAQLEDLAQRLDDLLTQLDGVQATPVVETKRVDYGQVHTASPTGLTARKSFDPRTDFQARAFGADQARRAT